MMAKRSDLGRLYLWEYPEDNASPPTIDSFEGWHLTADTAACARLSRALEDLSRGTLTEPQTFAVSPASPAVVAVIDGGLRGKKARSVRELRIVQAPDPRHFSLEERDGVLTISAGREQLDEIREIVIHIPDADGEFTDFTMIPDGENCAPDQALSFWWLLS
jgi:hypothetical protein